MMITECILHQLTFHLYSDLEIELFDKTDIYMKKYPGYNWDHICDSLNIEIKTILMPIRHMIRLGLN
jgi:hypothetical protein